MPQCSLSGSKNEKTELSLLFHFFFKDGDQVLLKIARKRWKFDKLGGGIFSLIRYMPLVVQVCQLPSFAIAGIQHHSTMISLYNAPIMLKITFFRFTKQSIGFKFNHRIRIQQWELHREGHYYLTSRENTSGIPQFTVQIVNTCVSGCAPSDLHLHCGWFASATLVNPKIFRRLAYDDCLVNEGKPLKTSHIIRFTYATSFMYPLGFKYAKFCYNS